MVTIHWSEQSRDDLKSIYDFIYKDSPKYANITINKIIELTDRLEQNPNSGRFVPEFNNKKIREIIYGNYRIIYKLEDKRVIILTVYHSARILKI